MQTDIITRLAETIAKRPCGACPYCHCDSEHRRRCWEMYRLEAQDVYEQFIRPLEEKSHAHD